MRAIAPLIVALVLLVVVGLRQPLPDQGFVADDAEWEESDSEEVEDEAESSRCELSQGDIGRSNDDDVKDVETGAEDASQVS